MSLLTKECEVCGTKINKLQKIWNIYALKAGKKIKCPKCITEYETYKIISLFGGLYSFFGPLIAILFIVTFIDSFNFNLGVEVWLYAWIIYSIIELVIMIILPLKKVKEVKDVTN